MGSGMPLPSPKERINMATALFHNNQFYLRITYSISQSVQNNTSTVSVSKIEICSAGTGADILGKSCSVNINSSAKLFVGGKQTGSFAASAYFINPAATARPTYASLNGYSPGKAVTIAHNADGSAPATKIKIQFLYQWQSFQSVGSFGPHEIDISVPTIPRASSISAKGATLGSAVAISITKAASGFTDTITWKCGNKSGTIAERSAGYLVSWTPDVSLAEQAPNDASVPVTITTTTFSGSTQVGSKSVTIKCPIPDSIVPTVDVQISDKTEIFGRYGTFVQGRSIARAITTAAGTMGSTIRSIAVKCDGIEQVGADVSFALINSGDVTVHVIATDSRGRTAGWSSILQVHPWQQPIVRLLQAARCDENGTDVADGAFLKVVFDADVADSENQNTAVYTLRTRIRGTAAWSSMDIPAYSGQYAPRGACAILPASVDETFECFVRCTDAFESGDSAMSTVPVGYAMMDFDRAEKAAGILQRAAEPDTLCIGARTKHYNHRITDVGDPEDDQDAVTKSYLINLVYPVGSVYMSFSDVSPGEIFGGTWERIKDRFLLAAGDSYAPGTTGGAAKVTLTKAQMPAVTGSLNFRVFNGNSTLVSVSSEADSCFKKTDGPSWGASVGTSAAAAKNADKITFNNGGSGESHNNMPPYLAINMWRRTV